MNHSIWENEVIVQLIQSFLNEYEKFALICAQKNKDDSLFEFILKMVIFCLTAGFF